MKQRLLEILKELVEIRKTTDLVLTDEVIFKECCSIYRGEMAGKSKKYHPCPIETNLGTPDKPSEKQVAFLNKHKVEIPKTKTEATSLIKTYIENQNDI